MSNLLPELGKSTNDSVSLTFRDLGYDVHHALALLEHYFFSIIPEGSYSSGIVMKMTGEIVLEHEILIFLTWILLIK